MRMQIDHLRPMAASNGPIRGYALYTFAGDKAPGDHTGQAVYAFAKTEGSEEGVKQALFVQNISKAPGAWGSIGI